MGAKAVYEFHVRIICRLIAPIDQLRWSRLILSDV
jgi:hypothetical protein